MLFRSGYGYELLIQKFLSLYGPQIDVHSKFIIQLYSDEWAQYIDLPTGFGVTEKCKLRLVPLQTEVSQERQYCGCFNCLELFDYTDVNYEVIYKL